MSGLLSKRKFVIFLSLFCASALFGWVVQSFAATNIVPEGIAVPGEYIVKLKKNSVGLFTLRAKVVESLKSKLGADAVRSLTPFAMDGTLQKVVLSPEISVMEVMSLLKGHPAVQYVEPNYRYYALSDGRPNDTYFNQLWGLENTGQKSTANVEGVPGADINVLPLWKAGFTGSRNILVAVIDTGVLWGHSDLADNIYTNPGEAGEKATNGIDDDGNGFIDDVHGWNFSSGTNDSNDDNNHGTHVSGTIGGVGNNTHGIAGVNWQVSILPVKFLSASGSGDTMGAVNSILYANKMGATVMNNSWGGGGYSQALFDAIKETEKSGAVFVAAAGNSAADNDNAPSYPASYPIDNVISVAATDNRDTLAGFSNYGKTTVHVAAPGVAVLSSIAKGGKYGALSGTSMASPHVAGAAALMQSINSNWDYREIKDRLVRTSIPKRQLSKYVASAGRIDVNNAIHDIQTPPIIPPDESLWISKDKLIETPHPYLNYGNYFYKIQHPGAKYLRLILETVDVEKGYDFVTIEGKDGVVIEKITGKHTNYVTEYVDGDELWVTLTSDQIVDGWGFKALRYEFIE